jgi:hypothetical protein
MSQDLFQKILDVKRTEGQPFHYYALLGIELFESDAREIHKAGLRQMKRLKEWHARFSKFPRKRKRTTVNSLLR